MCGRHSKDQCKPAGFGSVERATEVVARPGRGPIPPLCGGLVRRPVRRCSSMQFNKSSLNARRKKFESRGWGLGFRISMGPSATSGWTGFLLDCRIRRVPVDWWLDATRVLLENAAVWRMWTRVLENAGGRMNRGVLSSLPFYSFSLFFSPFFNIIRTYRFFTRCSYNGRISEMYVGMRKRAYLTARTAFPTRVRIASIGAIHILRKR